MTDKHEHNDELFRELFRQSGLEKAPEGFASRVMDAITSEEQAVNVVGKPDIRIYLPGSCCFSH